MARDVYQALRELKQLKDQGLLTEAEFKTRRQALMQDMTPLFDVPAQGHEPDQQDASERPTPWLLRGSLLGMLLLGSALLFHSTRHPAPTPPAPEMTAAEQTPEDTAPAPPAANPTENELKDEMDELSDILREALAQLKQARAALEQASGAEETRAQTEAYQAAVVAVKDHIADLDEAAADIPLNDDDDYSAFDELLDAASRAAQDALLSNFASEPQIEGVELKALQELLRIQMERRSGPAYADLEGHGYTLFDVPKVGLLEPDDSASFPMFLPPGAQYVIMGVCDDDCQDLDLAVMKGSQEMERDTTADDWPLVELTPVLNPNYQLTVTMYRCSTPSCGYQISVWTRPIN